MKNKIIKQIFITFLLLLSYAFSFAQTNKIPKNIQTLFDGKWIIVNKFQTNTLEIKFENGQNYATVIDIGSGEAPPLILKADFKNNKLVIPAKLHKNDYVEMTIKNNTLVFKSLPRNEKIYKTLIFNKVKK